MLIASNWICEEIADRSFVFRSACAWIAVSRFIATLFTVYTKALSQKISVILSQNGNNRATPFCLPCVALVHEGRQRGTHRRKIEQLPFNQRDLVRRQFPRIGAAVRPVQLQETGGFFQCKT